MLAPEARRRSSTLRWPIPLAIDKSVLSHNMTRTMRKHSLDNRSNVERLIGLGQSYQEISKQLGITKSCVYWHANEKNREYSRARRRRNRRSFLTDLKMKFGGRCSKCGYDKCLDALDFHHTNPMGKQRVLSKKGHMLGVSAMSVAIGQGVVTKEAHKCILLCANCHRELPA